MLCATLKGRGAGQITHSKMQLYISMSLCLYVRGAMRCLECPARYCMVSGYRLTVDQYMLFT